MVSYSSGTPLVGGAHGNNRYLHHPLPTAAEEGMLDGVCAEIKEDCASPRINGGGGGGNGHSINAIRASGIRVVRESPSSSGDFTAKLNQIPVSPFKSNQYLLSVPRNEPV